MADFDVGGVGQEDDVTLPRGKNYIYASLVKVFGL